MAGKSEAGVRMYGGEVLLRFEAATHSYWVTENGSERLVPSVTQALSVISKDALPQWAANCAIDAVRKLWRPGRRYDEIQIERALQGARRAHREVSGRAKDIGTLVHSWIEAYLRVRLEGKKKPPPAPVNEEARRGCRAAYRWLNRVKFTPLLTETRLYSRWFGYAGTQDSSGALARVENTVAVVDWKTSRAIYPEHRLQLAAYATAQGEMTGQEIRERWVVRLDKETGQVEPVRLPADELELDFQAFLNALGLFRRLGEIKEEE